jgi:RNA polymerase sigma factor (sigma-70 family)
MNKKVEGFITTNYYLLLSISKKITKNHDLTQDLLHEVILQLYDKDKINLSNYDNNTIKYYITAILRINWHSKTAPFWYKVRRERFLYTDLNDILDLEDDQEVFEREMLFELLEQEWCELNWFKKSLFEMYMTVNSLKKVAKQTTIPLSSVGRYIKEAKAEIKENVLNKINK